VLHLSLARLASRLAAPLVITAASLAAVFLPAGGGTAAAASTGYTVSLVPVSGASGKVAVGCGKSGTVKMY
jgi:hypothetical protein